MLDRAEEVLDRMSPFVRDMHTKNGLLDRGVEVSYWDPLVPLLNAWRHVASRCCARPCRATT